MKITSSSFDNNQKIPSKYTCDGENVSPPLSFSDIPTESKSLILIVDDPDAPGGVWTHWIVYNIAPDTTNIAENSLPAGSSLGVTSFGEKGYGGPCPPSGVHHYYFKLYALDTTLSLADNLTGKEIENLINNHILAKTQLVGLYSR